MDAYCAQEAAGKTCEDRVKILETNGRVMIALADGAGGTGGGWTAATAFIAEAERFSFSMCGRGSPEAWEQFLREADARIARDANGGQCTGIAMAISDRSVVGASVGDSEAWLVKAGQVRIVTENQRRKPLLGSGAAAPVSFVASINAGEIVLCASDGIFKYAPRDALVKELTSGRSLAAIAKAIVDSTRLKSGALQDDVSLAVIRI